MQRRYSRLISLVLIGAISPSILLSFPNRGVAQDSPASPASCAQIVSPLTGDELTYAQESWQYFVNNYQPETGFVNSVNNYPSITLWDLGNYLVGLNAARWLNLIDQSDFDARLNQFLQTLNRIELFDGALPNKVYNTQTGEMVDYGNQPVERGIGWSALDIGRLLIAFDLIRTCHPQYADWLQGTLDRWDLEASVQNGMMYGATVTPNGETMLVQEGRLGYEEYAARGYELWGYSVPEAISLDPFQLVDIYGIQIPIDRRNFQNTNANNYVVSESYILDAIEFGLEGHIAEYAPQVLEVQRRHYERTGELTAVTEDNIDREPYFLYNTVYANGRPWATITETNQPRPELRTLSTKAALGWYYLYPDNAYAQQLFERARQLRSPDGGGFYAGLYHETNQPNSILTANTNGSILQLLYYKALGNRPIIGSDRVSYGTGTPTDAPYIPAQAPLPPGQGPSPAPGPVFGASPRTAAPVNIAAIPPVGEPQPSACPALASPLTEVQRRSGEAAWQYFNANFNRNSGLVDDRNDMKATSLWGMGDYLAALHSARSLNIISQNEFDSRTRQLLGAMQALPLFAGKVPHRGYNTQTLQPIDYGANLSTPGGINPTAEGTGWSALDLGRMLSALYTLKSCHPQYTQAVDNLVLQWSYNSVIENGQLLSGRVRQEAAGRLLTETEPANRFGYEEYAARAFQLWGFNVEQSAVGDNYNTTNLEGIPVPTHRQGDTPHPYLTIDPFILYGLEFGYDPQMQRLVQPMLRAQTERYRRTGNLTAAGTTLSSDAPYILHNSLVGNGQAWATLTPQGQTSPEQRAVSTSVAFALQTLFPNDYTQRLGEATNNRYSAQQGYSEGWQETTGNRIPGYSASTNSIILQALLHRATNGQPIVRPESSLNSPWWQAVQERRVGQGLPNTPQPAARWDESGGYWLSATATPPVATPAPTTTTAQRPAPTQIQLSEADRIAAQRAWQYFERNWNTSTGLVDAVEDYAWTTLWDQGSAILGIHSARQLGLISPERFDTMMQRLLQTLETLPISQTTGLPNKAYSTNNAQMRTLNNQPDPQGRSGWSALDTARFLMALDVVRSQYPQYRDRTEAIVGNWNLSQLERDGWLYGGNFSSGSLRYFQEGRLGYEQYAAHALQRWGIEAENALNNPPTRTIEIEGVSLQVDTRNLENSNASNYLTNDPYLLWGLELGWGDEIPTQVTNLLQAQANRYARTSILTAVNEDSINRPPYFLYYNVYANDQPWSAITSTGTPHPQLRFLSTKAAFAWDALMPDNAYANRLREAVQNLADSRRGYLAGRYENSQLGNNNVINVNTNGIILESLLYKSRGFRPLAF